MKIAICDDNIETQKRIYACVSEEFSKYQISFDISTFSRGADLIKAHEASPFDVIFLDLMMPEMDGFATAKRLNKTRHASLLIFITTEESMVFDSFDFQPFSFIPKKSPEQLKNQIAHVISNIFEYKKETGILTLPLPHGEVKKVLIQDIICIQSDGNYVRFILADSTSFLIRCKLNDVIHMIESTHIIRIHNRYLINLEHVLLYDYPNGRATLMNHKVLEVSKPYRDFMRDTYNNYLRQGN